MKICAVIAEYNPFHSGHKYHLEQSRKLSGAECIVVIMSGNFTQRGEAAVFDKYLRAKCAIFGGADLVIELPFPFACAPAENFATGAVKLIKSLGCVDFLSFGSESGSIDEITSACAENVDIKANLSGGMSYAAAVGSGSDFFTPNNILAVEYLKALKKYAPEISPITLKRRGEGYSSEKISGEFISATACRSLIENKDLKTLCKYVPKAVFEILKDEITSGNYADVSKLDGLYLGLLRREKSAAMENIAYIKEGLENRFAELVLSVNSAKKLLAAVKTKRYTYTSLSRTLVCMAVGLTREKLNRFNIEGPNYANVLAASNVGREAIKKIKKNTCTISTLAGSKNLSGVQKEIFEITQTADSIYAITLGENPVKRRSVTF